MIAVRHSLHLLLGQNFLRRTAINLFCTKSPSSGGIAPPLTGQASNTAGRESAALLALCPLDGRYEKNASALREYFSEHALIRYRVRVEIEWLKFLLNKNMVLHNNRPVKISALDVTHLEQIYTNFGAAAAQRVKEIERTTNHDVKAVEYYIKEQLANVSVLAPVREYVHFCCTSEDINNLAYSLLMSDARSKALVPSLHKLHAKLAAMAEEHAAVPMLARTHGQVASPTTVGKELANFAYRIWRQTFAVQARPFTAKLNGAVGNFNAHIFAFPEYAWPQLSEEFVRSLGLAFNPYTTQIEPHDSIAEFYNSLHLLNTVLIGAARDLWTYTSHAYFTQRSKSNEVGSSTMPHKVNPIDFENAEGNLGLGNALARHFAEKLPISRLQRDLSDSTVMRNHGLAFGYSLVAYRSFLTGLEKLEPNVPRLQQDLDAHWEILAEPIQTVMRKYNVENPYELLKKVTRGVEKVDAEDLRSIIRENTKLPEAEKKRLLALTPSTYLGNAAEMAAKIKNFCK